MMSGLVIVGLLFIILGWLVQLYYSAGRKIIALSMKFVLIYVLGSLLLMIDALQTGNVLNWILNLAAAVFAFLAGYFAKKARP
jgi:lipid-A-disaccharide synthase-like uncharacterized protein